MFLFVWSVDFYMSILVYLQHCFIYLRQRNLYLLMVIVKNLKVKLLMSSKVIYSYLGIKSIGPCHSELNYSLKLRTLEIYFAIIWWTLLKIALALSHEFFLYLGLLNVAITIKESQNQKLYRKLFSLMQPLGNMTSFMTLFLIYEAAKNSWHSCKNGNSCKGNVMQDTR